MSQSPEVVLRNLLALEIASRQVNSFFDNNAFNISQVWLPLTELVDLRKNNPQGILYLVSGVSDEGANQSRTAVALRQTNVLFGFQQANVDVKNVSQMDALADLVYQLQIVCRDFKGSGYSWVRTEPARDENGIPIVYATAHNQGVFEAYFTAYYNYVVVEGES